MRITKHDKCYIVELSDSSAWRIWPADMADTLQWLRSDGSQVRVIRANRKWPVDEIGESLVQ